MRVTGLRAAVRSSAQWPLYTQLLVAGGVVIAASIVVIAVRDGAGDTGTAVPASTSTASSRATSTSVAVTSGVASTAPSVTTSATTASSAPSSSPVVTVGPAPTNAQSTLAPADTASDLVLDLLQTIPVELEHRGGYDRDLFAVWSDLDRDGCDTRDEVLRSESLDIAQTDPRGCPVIAGRWYSVYDGQMIDDPAALDIDHVVALKEAWDSGAWSWSPDRRIAYANDQIDGRTLVAVSATSNREKGDRDPSNWRPSVEDQCRYIADWVAIKARWELSMDSSEWGRIKNLLEGPCLGTTVAA